MFTVEYDLSCYHICYKHCCSSSKILFVNTYRSYIPKLIPYTIKFNTSCTHNSYCLQTIDTTFNDFPIPHTELGHSETQLELIGLWHIPAQIFAFSESCCLLKSMVETVKLDKLIVFRSPDWAILRFPEKVTTLLKLIEDLKMDVLVRHLGDTQCHRYFFFLSPARSSNKATTIYAMLHKTSSNDCQNVRLLLCLYDCKTWKQFQVFISNIFMSYLLRKSII